jgi:NTE family protein
MGKRALVLSGGGAKGAFQAGALEHLIKTKGMEFDIVCGVSVGALNGTMVAQGDFDLLKELWYGIRSAKDVYVKRRFWEPIAALTGASSFYRLTPLRKKIDRLVDVEKIQSRGVELRVGTVSLRSGKYDAAGQTDSSFKAMLQASATIPVAFEPLNVSQDRRDVVDGGLRNQTPLGEALELGADEIVLVLCNPIEASPDEGPFDNILSVGLRSLDLVLNEIFREDLSRLDWINEVLENNPQCELRTKSGRPMKKIPRILIEPPESPNDTLGFTPKQIDRAWKMGVAAAEVVVP